MARDEATSWSTPLVVEIDQKPQIVVSASGYTRGYDLATGAVIWKSSGLTLNVIPSPVYAEGIVYVMSGFRGSALQAIRLKGASGEIDDSDAILWRHDKDTPYTPSPLLYKDLLYFLKINKEELSCFNALTGEPYYKPQKLENIKGVYASPVGAADRVYIAGRNGVTYVIEHGPDFEILAENHLDDKFDASPVIVDRELYLRGIQSLYCISQD